MPAVVAQGRLISAALFSLYANDIPTPPHHVDLTLYADDSAFLATSHKPTMLVSYLRSTSTTFNGG
jgi:hypothetical protein